MADWYCVQIMHTWYVICCMGQSTLMHALCLTPSPSDPCPLISFFFMLHIIFADGEWLFMELLMVIHDCLCT